MKQYLILLFLASIAFLHAERPRWGFLGGDKELKEHFEEVSHVGYICVTDVELRNVKAPFADVVFHATVIDCYKGNLEVGQKIQITFHTDSLPADEGERREFIEKANAKNQGSLKFAFIHGGADHQYDCDFMDVPDYSLEMFQFLSKLRVQAPKAPAEKKGEEKSAK